MKKKKYFAFISYSHKDSELAKWLQHEFEYYELPSTLFDKRKDLHKEDLPESFRPIFRDEDELAGGVLHPQISEALADSEYLIVVCSPNSAQSPYVDNEIKEFLSLSQDNKRKVFPFIVNGKPHQDERNKKNECFTKTLLELRERQTDPIELIAADIHATGRDHAFVKIIAGVLNEKDIRFSDLWDRYAIEKAEKERKEREYKERLQIVQSRFLAEKSMDLFKSGDLLTAVFLALEAFPKSLIMPNRPYVAEVEAVLRRMYNAGAWILKMPGRISKVTSNPNGSCFAFILGDSIVLVDVVNDSRKIIKAHDNNITSVVLSHNSRMIAAFSWKTFSIIDVESGTIQRVILMPSDEYAKRGLFSPDDERILVYDRDAIRIWDSNTGVLLCTIGKIKDEREYYNYFSFASYNHYGDKIVSVSGLTLVTIWDSSTGNKLMSYRAHELDITQVEFSKDDKYIIYSSLDKTIKMLDVSKQTIVSSFYGHESGVSCFVLHNDYIISASLEGTIRFWDTRTNKCIKKLEGHSKRVVSLSIVNNNVLLSCSIDNTIRFWDIEMDFSDKTIEGHHDSVCCARYSHDGKKIVSTDGKEVKIWDIEKGVSIMTFSGLSWETSSVSFSPNDDYIIVASFDNCIRIFESKKAALINTLKGHEKSVNTAWFNNDGSKIISASNDGKVKIWDFNSGECLLTLVDHLAPVNCAIFDKKGDLVASASSDRTIKIWDSRTGVLLFTLYGHLAQVLSIDFSPDGSKLVSSSRDNTIKIWDLKKQKLIDTIEGHKESSILCVSYSNDDGRYIASAANDNTVRIWDASTGVNIETFYGHTGYVRSVVFSSDNKYLLSASNDKTIKMWSFTNLQEIINEFRNNIKEMNVTEELRKKFYLDYFD